MKNYILLWLCLCLLLSGCTATGPQPSELPLTLSSETVTAQCRAEDGTLLLERSYPLFTLTGGDETVAQDISSDLQSRIGSWMASSAELEDYAREEYPQTDSWSLWFARLTSQLTRLDSQILSLYLEYSEFTGGAHPQLSPLSLTYSCKTGKLLELSQLLAEGCSPTLLASAVNGLLEAQASLLYDDYEALVGKAFSEGAVSWYLSDNGLCVYFAPYDIGPYASGIITTSIPYSQLSGIMKDEYIPA